MHASNGILFNHEGPMRGETFVTRKITRAVAAIERGLQEQLYLGNLDAKRDWGHARDYVEGMWLIAPAGRAGRLRAGDRRDHSVREFVELRLRRRRPHHRLARQGRRREGLSTRKTGDVLVGIDPRYFRPTEVDCCSATRRRRAASSAGATKTSFEELVAEMVESDLAGAAPTGRE